MKSMLKITGWIALVAIAAFLAGRFTASDTDHTHQDAAAEAASQAAGPVLWTCPMHPQIRLPDDVPCPICGMDLVPVGVGDDTGSRQLAMSPQARVLARIEVAPVERRFVSREIRMVGKVDFDETRMRTVTSRIPGESRLERLYVDYTGVPVQAGEHLVLLYSPALLAAQEELLEARRRIAAPDDGSSEFMTQSNRRGYETARQKLLLFGLTEKQVDEIEARGGADDHVMITSPVSGYVVRKARNQGDYVSMGEEIYTIADLSKLWVRLHAYEQDLAWIRYGQEVAVFAEAYPGRPFTGTIAFIDPVLDDRTRTVSVRVNLDNSAALLKPGMFVRGTVRSRLALGGKVMDPALAGKWISPMHPEIVKDGPGICDVCGMDLVPAEELGIVRPDDLGTKPLVVPASSVLLTGTRAVVYVEVPNTERPTYEGREITLGPRAGDHYLVLGGLEEHENVVVRSAFKIDSALQIQAKPSMMSMPKDPYQGKNSATFRMSLQPLYAAYFEVQEALSGDAPAAAGAAAARLESALDQVLDEGLATDPHRLWNEERPILAGSARKLREAGEIEAMRRAFRELSRAFIVLEDRFGHAGSDLHREVFCPMAFGDEGAAWLQRKEEIQNPYFGASMLLCGEIRRVIPGLGHEALPAGGGEPSPEEAAGREMPPADPPSGPPERDSATPAAAKEPASAAPPRDFEVARVTPLYAAYLELQRGLAADDVKAAQSSARELGDSISELRTAAGAALPRVALEAIEAALPEPTADLATTREAFERVSKAFLALHSAAGSTATYYRLYCPMAFGRGASWLQADQEVLNPYLGARMLRCGRVEETLKGAHPR